MANLNIYLNFMGNTEEAFNFYKSVFGGEFTMLQRQKDTPDAGKRPPAELEKIMHVSLPVGKNMILMGTDMLESMGHKLLLGNNMSISINAESKEEADKLFAGLGVGGKVGMPLMDMFWGAYFGLLIDKFGVQWMVNFDHPKK